MSNFKGKMYSVHSGNISKVGWEFDDSNPNNKKGVLRVEFNRGATYDYWPVPKSLYDEMWKSNSKGKWFQENIKNAISISYEKVEL